MSLQLSQYIDHTLLKPEATEEQIISLCKEALQHRFAAVCVNPCWVKTATDILASSSVKVCTVIGFPLGANTTSIKLSEAKEALSSGAREIDMVINIARVKMQDAEYLRKEIISISKACKVSNAELKVILETFLLTEEEKVFAVKTALEAGADFVKTSTGFAGGGATEADVRLLRSIASNRAGVKASGGIRSLVDALKMIEAGANRVGTSSGVAIMREYLGSGSD